MVRGCTVMSVDRRTDSNVYKTPHLPANERWKRHNAGRLKSEALSLNAEQRKSVKTAIDETCAHRKWRLHAVNVRTNHAPRRGLNWSGETGTRPQRVQGKFHSTDARRWNWQQTHSPWADKGSKRHLRIERSVALAIDYVLNGQGGDLSDFG
jgi:hypothetical protein